ncbi:MAG: efflux transporter outer membrane subunit [Bacteroidota bacterium]
MFRKYSRIPIIFIILTLLLATGCKVGPNYKRPVVITDSLFRFATSGDTLSIADIEWVKLFKDTVLRQLIDTGLKNNWDIRIAFSRIEQAMANFKIERGKQWPTLSAQAQAGYQEPGSPGNTSYSAMAGISWEIDLWGKLRRSKEAARANLFGQVAYQQAVRITLIYNIVASYFNLLEFDNELRVVQENIVIRQQSLNLVKAKMIAGTASGLVVAQAEAELALAQTEVPKLQMQIGQEENFLSTLIGKAPHAIPRGRPMLDQINFPDIKTPGLASTLIVRRPDIIIAEQSLVAANANIGVARAMMLPSLSISGNVGAIFDPTKIAYNALGNLIAPIFGGGQLRAGVKKAQAYKEEILFTYLQTINTSLKEVSNALLEVQKQKEIVLSQQKTVDAAQTAFDLSNQLYNAGYASYLDVIQAQSLLFSSQINLSLAQSNELTSFVNLYTALGGGWK